MFEALPLTANLGLFAAAAPIVWFAGARIARYADAIAEKTGIGRELLGIALLGRDALTSVLASPGVALQGVLGIILLTMVVAATMTFDVPLLGASAWTWALLFGYVIAVRVVAKSRSGEAWHAAGRRPPRPKHTREPGPLRPLVAKIAAAGAAVLVAGFFLAKTGEAIAAQAGLGTNFVGVVLLAAATSLPEVSTVVGAVRLRRYEMAVADVFGTNLFNVTIIFVVGALLAIALTALYLAGMIERRDRTVLRMGFDSLAALGAYAGGLAVLYQLR